MTFRFAFTRLARPLSHLKPSPSSIQTSRTQFQIQSQSQSQQVLARYASNFQTGPAPPRLPAEEQAEFERLQRTANTQGGFNPTSTPSFSESQPTAATNSATTGTPNAVDGRMLATSAIDDEPDMIIGSTPLRKGAPPEFTGEVNPKTGEVGGPKNEPLRWGSTGDYSFNGRVTDF